MVVFEEAKKVSGEIVYIQEPYVRGAILAYPSF